MNLTTIEECNTLSLAGKITFPEVLARLFAAGVERYMVDLVGKQKFSYGPDAAHVEAMAFESVSIPAQFDAAAVRQAVVDSQQGNINYQTFLRRIMEAGCSHYEVFIGGGKVVYVGRNGGQHVEEFPGLV